MNETYDVRVMKDSLVFSAAHFITYAGGLCEPIHGHNYRVETAVAGPLDENHYVFDFIALRDETRAIVETLDHRVLLPTRSRLIHVEAGETQTTARFGAKHWSFPTEDCVLLPIENTTAELLARWIGGELHRRWAAKGIAPPGSTRVSVEENFGQWATCRLTRPGSTPPAEDGLGDAKE
ncbi:MAG: 6-pyruvoyl trahydropterin synthase family protein [Planctomycetia bacterium]